jgi:hypothetical protein
MTSVEQKINLIENQEKRHYAIHTVYLGFLKNMTSGKQKQMKFRKWFRMVLTSGSIKVFDTEEDEYQFINRFGRGMWDKSQLDKTFSIEDMLIIVELAKEYGAFDY